MSTSQQLRSKTAGGTGIQKEHPLDILSADEWLIIFDKLSPRELYASSQACVTFPDLLEPQWGLLLATSALPLFASYLSKADHLNCRLVCRWWKRSVEEQCQSLVHFQKNLGDTKVFLVYKFRRKRDIDDFLFLMEKRPRKEENPFISRHLLFDDSSVASRPGLTTDERKVLVDQYWSSVGSLLSEFGEHVWYCELEVSYYSSVDLGYFYSQLIRDFCSKMPNLRGVYISNGKLYVQLQDPHRQPQELQHIVDTYPLSPLAKVVHLQESGLPVAFIKEILRSCDKTKLEHLCTSASGIYEGDTLTKFQNLKAINFRLMEMDLLSALPDVSWPLVEAKLALVIWDSTENTFGTVLEWLNRFEETLRTLEIVIPYDFVMEEEVELRIESVLRLPHLKTLDLNLGPYGICSLNFIVELKKLEDLELEMSYFTVPQNPLTRDVDEKIIQFSGYASSMLHSNIWKVMPSLKQLSLRDRKGWYDYQWRGSPEKSICNQSTFSLSD